jgi:hypothetical protein
MGALPPNPQSILNQNNWMQRSGQIVHNVNANYDAIGAVFAALWLSLLRAPSMLCQNNQ